MKTLIILLLFPTLLLASTAPQREPTLELLVEKDRRVKQAYEECQRLNRTRGSDGSACLQERLEANKHLQDVINEHFRGENQTASESSDSPALGRVSTFRNRIDNKNPGIAKLKEYLSERLEKLLYGEVQQELRQQGKITIVDHGQFYQLYKKQISGNIIAAVSSYCIDADSRGIISSTESERSSQRSTNLENLNRFSAITNGKKQMVAFQNWGQCITKIPEVCHKPPTGNTYTKERACRVTRYLKGLRQDLLRLSQVEEVMNQFKSGRSMEIHGENLQFSNASEEDMAKINTLSSKELVQESGYEQAMTDQAELIEQCRQNGDMAPCQQFLQDQETVDSQIQDYELREELALKNLDQMNTEEELTAYLESQGRTEAEIQQLLQEAEGDLARVKQQIIENYSSEKESIIASIRDQMQKKVVRNSEEQTPEQQQAAISSTLSNIQTEFQEDATRLKELTHFNNIVSGFLQVESKDSSGKVTLEQNTAALFQELENNAFAPTENRVPADSDPADQAQGFSGVNTEQLSQHLETEGITDSNKASEIQIDTVNQQLLKMDEE